MPEPTSPMDPRTSRILVIIASVLCFFIFAFQALGQDEEQEIDEMEGQRTGWEFVPGSGAEAAAGLIDLLSAEGDLATAESEPGFDPRGLFMDVVDVRLLPLTFRIVDPWARPIRDLEVGDLEAEIGDLPIPIAAVDWYGSYETPEVGAQARTGELPAWNQAAESLDPYAEVRHLVIFMQIGEYDNVGLERSLIWGHLKSLPGLERLLRHLGPSDRVALVSQGTHMQLWHDFTTDHKAIHDLLFESVGYGEPQAPPAASQGHSLAEYFEYYDLGDVTSTGEAMLVLAEALAEIPGAKDVIYIGWSFAGAQDDLQAALSTLVDHQSVVSVLVSAQRAGVGGPLAVLANHTGGTIAGTLEFPGRSVDRLSRSLSGHYVVSLDLSGQDELDGRLVLRVKGQEAKVISRPYEF